MDRWRHAFVLALCAMQYAGAQISPGELSEPHAVLEGIGNCTNCHTIGKTLSNANCLNCHTEIGSRLRTGKGYHASVASKECVECHKEHHGRTFRIIRFDRSQFDHAQTGYRLEGKHAALSCERCHTASRLTAKDVQPFSDRRKRTTFLGLGTACFSCHEDQHRGQFTQDCRQCHSLDGWKPASRFSHDRTKFVLSGAHAKVPCAGCHQKTWDRNAAVQYIRMEFSSCRSCHADPHKGRFTQECAQCHSPASWKQVKSAAFDHRTTSFPLAGKHAALRCEQCHPKDPKALNPAGERGFHITKFAQCLQCHADAHAAQFAGRSDKGDCRSCHTEDGFGRTTFTVNNHDRTAFPLTGAHKAVPCIQCHRDGVAAGKCTKQFRWNGPVSCTTCHADIHQGQFKERMTEGCETCHSTADWEELKFSHATTRFPLKGRHAEIGCRQCHTPVNGTARYTGMKRTCAECHADVHAGQFDNGQGTACERCHSEKGWKALVFDHNAQARFPLTGKHENVPCAKCHKECLVNNIRTIKYKPLEAACADCHPAQ